MPRVGKILVGLMIACGAAAATVGIAPAYADENSYLADLQAHGVPFLIPAKAVSDGYRVCSEIRAGESPQTAAQTFGIYYNALGPTIVDIAQHDLCRDTLR
ncbi:DUF732 domain-containing protein [Mycobacterium paraffinicum]|uniref:DUF732 domain-containing protein n=1 Tax=Mycobacterium paraffinicum TaxID=53378 RepID=A0ABP8EYV6_9MYCO|nr:DUF732 domain-containing protein [Mycobacterium paraffinicum]MCV7309039.1 DUF732 domain-containing protein [Mycobacterium paraffinicum]